MRIASCCYRGHSTIETSVRVTIERDSLRVLGLYPHRMPESSTLSTKKFRTPLAGTPFDITTVNCSWTCFREIRYSEQDTRFDSCDTAGQKHPARSPPRSRLHSIIRTSNFDEQLEYVSSGDIFPYKTVFPFFPSLTPDLDPYSITYMYICTPPTYLTDLYTMPAIPPQMWVLDLAFTIF